MARYIMPVSEVKNYANRMAKASLIAVVVEFSIPRKSEGTDYCSILKVIDQSQQSPELSVNVFTDDIRLLPHIRSRRDIILISSVQIKTRNQEVYVVFNKKFSSFALFDGQCSSDFSPYQNSPTFSLLNSDKQYITSLRNWCLTLQLDAGISDYLVSLKDIKQREYFDLVCKVLGVYEGSSNEWLLFLWDGTDAPPLSLNAKLEEHNSIQLQIESAPLPTNILDKFPCVGTILRVIASRAYENLGHNFHYIGDWMRIRNLVCEVESGLWKGFLISRSKIRLLSENDNSVKECKRKFIGRLSLSGRIPMSSHHVSNFLTVTAYETSRFTTLMDLLTLSKDKDRFKCVVRMVAICPPQAKDFWSPAGQYRMKITLEDPTARVHALLCDEDAEMFFGGYPSVDELAAKMHKLLGLPENNYDLPRNPPWIQCCIEFRSSNEAVSSSGSGRYHICHTKLVPE